MSKRWVQVSFLAGLIASMGACSSGSGSGSNGSKGIGGIGGLGGSSSGSSGSSGSSSGSSGGSSGSSSGGGQTCTANDPTACNQCLAGQCCGQALGCDGDTACSSALQNCGDACNTSEAACASCVQQAQNTTLSALYACVQGSCASPCFGGGSGSSGGGSGGTGNAAIGDACSATKLCPSNAACVQNSAGQDVFCTTTCTLNADCGSASNGAQNICVSTTSGEQLCAPGCDNATCPAGTTCEQIPVTGSSAMISVCAPN